MRRAYGMVCNLKIVSAKKPICILGSLVHNPEVNRKVDRIGIHNITREEFFQTRKGEIGTVIITAHGTGPDVFVCAKKNDIVVLDTTCPKVIKVQKLANLYAKKGYAIVLIGDKKHKEVRGINDWGNKKALIISNKKDWDNPIFNKVKKVAVLSQTTQNEDFFCETVAYLKNNYPKTKFKIFNTTCNTTQLRQNETKKMASANDAILIIGSNTSANSHRLWEISQKINPRSYFIENAKEIDKKWLKDIKAVGVVSGASTPDWIINEVLVFLQKFSSKIHDKTSKNQKS